MTLTIVLIYFAAVAAIGIVGYFKVRGSTDQYFVAGRGVGTFANSWAFLATLASGGSVMAALGTGLALGYPYGAALVAGAPVGFVVASVLVARHLRSIGKYTVPDFFAARFGSRTLAWFTPIVIIVASVAYIVAQLKGASIVASHLLGWDTDIALWAVGIVFVLYVSLGGFLSVTWNDIFQGILMFAMVIGFGITAFASVDDFGASFTNLTQSFPEIGHLTPAVPLVSIIGGFLTWATAISVTPHVIMRVYSARNVRSARLSLNWAMLIFAVMMIIISLVLTPVAAELIADAGELDADAVLLTLADRVLNSFGQGVVTAAILAAIMSTTAGLLMACNSAVAHDIYKKLLRPDASEKAVVRVATVATWIIGLVCILLTLNPPEFLVVLYTAAVALLASSFFAPMVLGIWWRRTTTQGAVAGVLCGAIVFAVLFGALDMPDSSQILVSLPVSFLATIGVSLATGSPRRSDPGEETHRATADARA
ncbi:sodium:solute symporter family protein [Tomitella gaofuii]|uniref:sodium:solute symporter family protein n=1 Tax=Tomitella gaofuii TaxID=2760083 RepID=UPI0015F8398C|nr:sodium/solute symporter [Tomitella gaofuii]